MKVNYQILSATTILGVLMLSLGCGQAATSVHGTVTCKGKPVSGIEVLFAPDVGTVGKPMVVQPDALGEFTIEDAVVGTHKVRVYPTRDEEDGGKPLTCKPPTDLTFVVESGVENEFVLEL